MCKRLNNGKNELAAEWSQIGRERKKEIHLSPKVVPIPSLHLLVGN